MVEIGDEGRGEEKENVEHNAHHDIEPENGIVLFVRWLSFVGQRRRETTLLQHAGDIGEDDERRHLAIVLRSENVDEPQSKERT